MASDRSNEADYVRPVRRLVIGVLALVLLALFLLWRIDNRFELEVGRKLAPEEKPSFFFRRNFVITTSGVCDNNPLIDALAALGADNVLFSVDYPYQESKQAGDFIEAVQGIPGGPHGADPDEMTGVIPLRTGSYDDGRPVWGWPAHSGMLNRPSDAWRAILAVIVGDSQTLQQATAR